MDWKATQWGKWLSSPSTLGFALSPLACAPFEATLTRESEPPRPLRRRTKMSLWPLLSPRTRLLAALAKAK